MMEPVIVVFCLQRDKTLVQEILEPCKREYEALLEEKLGIKREVTLRLNDKTFLQERDLPDLSALDIATINDDHESAIKISNKEDDRYW